MTTYRLNLELHSPLGTPLVADTLFGHLCWGMIAHEGPDALARFLLEMKGDHPPLVISDPLPADHWPMPVLPAPASNVFEGLLSAVGGRAGDLPRAHDRLRDALRQPFLPARIWARCAANLCVEQLGSLLLEPTEAAAANLIETSVAHNTINRVTGRPLEEGGLFFDTQWFHGDDARYDVWIRSSWTAERICEVFERGLSGGYGRDASTGKGHLAVARIEEVELPHVANPNGVMTLGTCAPAAEDPLDGYWNVDVRMGKLGGPWACTGEDDTAFKYPVILLARGAVFRSNEARPTMGRIVEGVHPTRKEVVTCGLTLTLPVRLTEDAQP